MQSRHFNIVALALFIIYFINGVIAIPQLSVTFDEGDNLSYGIRFIKGHPEKIKPYDDASTMPVLAFNTVPRAAQQVLTPGLIKSDGGKSDIMSGRYVTLFLSAFIGLFVLKWSSELYGKKAGLLSLFLFVFCPNINGNAVLITSDALSCLLTITSAYYFWKSVHDSNWKNVIFFFISLAVAQLTKQSLTHLLIIFSLIAIILFIQQKKVPALNKDFILKLVVSFVIFLFIINAGFLFSGTGQSLSSYHFKSSVFNSIQRLFSFAGSMPLPFPEPYISGLDLTMNIDEIGAGLPETSGNVNILGESRMKSGFWYYYLVTFFFKTPVPVLFLCCFLLYILWRQEKYSLRNAFIPFFCILYFLIYFSFFYNSQVGIRHIIMIFPLLYVLLGKTADWLFSKKVVFVLLVVYSIITYYLFFPNLIAYSNEFIANKKNAYRIIGNANLDYGQSYFLLHKFMDKHQSVKFAGETPSTGQFVIAVGDYLDVNNTGRYKWLQNFKPVAHVAHSFLLFDISENDFKKMEK